MSDIKPWYKRPLPLAAALLGGLVALLVLFLIGETVYFIFMFKTGKRQPAEPYQSTALRANIAAVFSKTDAKPEELRRLEGVGNPALGNPAAKVRIVEFADFDCPYSKQMAPILREYLRGHASEVYLVIRDFPATEIHPTSEDAAVAARCVLAQGQDLYWRYHDWLYENQGSRTPQELTAGAGAAGADINAFGDCLKKRSGWQDIQLGLTDAVAFGVVGTPTFFFNGAMMPEAMEKDFFEIMVDEARKKAESAK